MAYSINNQHATNPIPFWFGPLALLFYLAHAAELLIWHNAQDLLWVCNVAALLAGIALLTRHVLLNACASFMLVIGTFYWLIDLAVGGDFLWTSILTHVGVGGMTLYVMWHWGLPRTTWYLASIGVTLIIWVSGWISDPEVNINTTRLLPPGPVSWYPSHAMFLLTQILFSTLFLFLYQWLLRRFDFSSPAQNYLQFPPPVPRTAAATETRQITEYPLTVAALYSDGPARDVPGVASYEEQVNPAYMRALGMLQQGRLYTHAQDVWLWDHRSNRYLDCSAGYGAVNIGHNHPALIDHLHHHLDQNALQFVHLGPSVFMGELAARLTALAGEPLSMVAFSNTGAEAVETAIKMARTATRRQQIIYFHGAYHGTSLGTRFAIEGPGDSSNSSQSDELHAGLPFGDLDTLEQALRNNTTAAVLLDPGMCEIGLITLPQNFLSAVKQLCQRYKSLLILDEVQTGLGRTGKWFAYQHTDCVPDILVLAKSLSGGISPIGATLAPRDVFMKTYGSHTDFDKNFTTFGGNSLSCYAAIQTLAIIEREELVANGQQQGAALLEELRNALHEHPLIKDIRGQGLLIALELGATDQSWLQRQAPELIDSLSRGAFGQWLVTELLAAGLVCQTATLAWNVIKLMPPLTLQTEQRQQIVTLCKEVFENNRSVTGLCGKIAGRFSAQAVQEWNF